MAVVVTGGPDRGARLEVGESARVVGRAREADLVLTDPTVSRRHLEVVALDGRVEIRTLAGAAPFLVGEAPVERATVAPGERVVLGSTVLSITAAPQSSGAPASDAEVTQIADVLGGPAADARGLRALFALSQALDAATDESSVSGAAAAWAREHAGAASATLIHAPDAARGFVEQPAPGGSGTLVRVPAGGVPDAAIELTLLSSTTSSDDLKRLLVLAGALCGSTLARLRAIDSIEQNSRALRRLAVGSAERFLGTSPAAQQIAALVPRLASSDAVALLLGETGVGKSFVARLIHEAGPRAREPLRVINCAAVPEGLVEAELFGHERGAFTGASGVRVGAFEAAGRGTVLLDEIAELPPASQAKLLRVLEERKFERIGSNRSIPLEARVLAATNRDLREMMQTGSFRSDLFFRISVVTVRIPALRERGDDVIELARHLLADLAASAGRRIVDFSPAAVESIRRHSWPGNVRELRNAIEHAIVLGDGPVLDAGDFPLPLEPPPFAATRSDASPPAEPQSVRLDELEEWAIERALQRTGGNRTKAAALLGIDRVTLYHKLKKRPPSE